MPLFGGGVLGSPFPCADDPEAGCPPTHDPGFAWPPPGGRHGPGGAAPQRC